MTTPDPAAIAAALDELAELRAAVDVTRLDFNAKRADILATVQDELDALESEYAQPFAAAAERDDALTAEIRAAVLAVGATVKGATLRAVYNRGRTSWDGKSLNGYAAAHPEILAFQTTGEAYVSLGSVK